ncbi:hypothetical protein ACIBEK_07420 [Nocardia fusca]|uniref:hypothetical protein n=1 Tax=Nocardia fusca TaxID=941183 RepID=UPI00379FDDB6
MSDRLPALFRELTWGLTRSIREGSDSASRSYRMGSRRAAEAAGRIERTEDRAELAFGTRAAPDRTSGADISDEPVDVNAPMAADEPPIRTGLGSQVDLLLGMTGRLTERTFQVMRQGWSIRYGDHGQGTFAHPGSREIVIDRNHENDAEQVFFRLAHEVGHADDPDLARVFPYRDGESREEWVRRRVHEQLRREGEATLVEIEAIRDLRDAGYRLTRAPLSERQAIYEAIYDSHRRGYLSRHEAKDEIAAMFRDETISGTVRNYEEVYLERYAKVWDADHIIPASASEVEPFRDQYRT